MDSDLIRTARLELPVLDRALIDGLLEDPTGVDRFSVLDSFRSQGFASEAGAGLIGWARSTGDVAAVIACVRPGNAASLAVLDRLGGFEQIGSCRDGDDVELVFRLDLK